MENDDGLGQKSRIRLRRSDVVLPDLSYRIVGCLFEVSNEIGSGHLERIYQRAIAESFKRSSLSFKEQVRVPVTFKDKPIGWYQLDFLIEDVVVLELKQGNHYRTAHMKQLLSYLKSTNKPIAIIATFRSDGVICKRLVNKDALK
jgi:GxxExxY protein